MTEADSMTAGGRLGKTKFSGPVLHERRAFSISSALSVARFFQRRLGVQLAYAPSERLLAANSPLVLAGVVGSCAACVRRPPGCAQPGPRAGEPRRDAVGRPLEQPRAALGRRGRAARSRRAQTGAARTRHAARRPATASATPLRAPIAARS